MTLKQDLRHGLLLVLIAEFPIFVVCFPERNALFLRIAHLCLLAFGTAGANPVTSGTFGKRPGPWDTVIKSSASD